MIMGVVVFIVVITFSIALHELGHLATAKYFGMKATRYFIGFGPTLWSTHRGETEYGVKAFPIGGFVKIVGMTPLEELEPGDEDRAFYKQPAAQRAVVLAAGSTMHFILAIVLLFFALTVIGVTDYEKPTTTIDAVSACLSTTECTSADPDSPAKAAGLRPGDKVLEFDGEAVDDWATDLTARVRAHEAGPAQLLVERDGERLDLTVNIARVERQDEDGKTIETGFVGLTAKPSVQHYGPAAAGGKSVELQAETVRQTADAIVGLPGQIPDLVRQSIGNEERDGTGAASLIGAGRVAGQASKNDNLAALVGLMAAINIFIGIFNLLPLLPLDGGHLAVLWFEEFRSSFARWRKRPNPGRVDLAKLMPLTYVFLFLLISLQVLVLYADIANPIPDPFTRG
jgi:membrane-associated protease RseP (regulator of RpoE activity)